MTVNLSCYTSQDGGAAIPLTVVASPLEVAALWRLNLLSGEDIAIVCMQWLEQDLDHGDPNIAAFAGQPDLVREEIAPIFEAILTTINGRSIDRDEATLRALRLYLASTLKGDDLLRGVQLIIDRLAHSSDRRLVWNPRRSRDRPDEVYAEQNLGLEYVYGRYYAFDDIGHLSVEEQAVAEAKLHVDLRESVQELHAHLTAMLDDKIQS
jgi:hypothetical protein